MQPNPQMNAQNGAAVLIRCPTIPGNESFGQAVLHTLPAWIISGAIHVGLLFLFLFVTVSGGALGYETETVPTETKIEDPAENANLTNEDIGLNPDLPTNYNVDRIEEVSVPGAVDVNAAVGVQGAPEAPAQTLPPPPGAGNGQGGGIDVPGVTGKGSPFGTAGGLGGIAMVPGGFAGRSGATRQKMVETGGGNEKSEAAVARALKWFALHQAPDGHWSLNGFHQHARDKTGPGARLVPCNCDGRGSVANDVAGTAFALLPFLAAGETHRPPTTKGTEHYTKQVEQGLKWLLSKQNADGDFAGSGGMYGHGLAAIVLCEAYGLTSDPNLKGPAQRAIDYIVKAQHVAGGWRYSPNQAGDTSVVGWQVMALKSGQMAGLNVPKATLDGAMKFLDSVMDPYGGYGYTGPQATPTMTAVGLLCREYLGWSPRNIQLINGVTILKKTPPEAKLDTMYYYYYATQVMHHVGGQDWDTWNKPMRDWLIARQDQGDNPKFVHQKGSWDPKRDAFGGAGGRVMITSMCTLTLEVYYRHLPLYRRDLGGMKGEAGAP